MKFSFLNWIAAGSCDRLLPLTSLSFFVHYLELVNDEVCYYHASISRECRGGRCLGYPTDTQVTQIILQIWKRNQATHRRLRRHNSSVMFDSVASSETYEVIPIEAGWFPAQLVVFYPTFLWKNDQNARTTRKKSCCYSTTSTRGHKDGSL